MKPYYEHAGITIYHGDYRDVLPNLERKIDVVLTDPDYNGKNLGVREGEYIGGMPQLSEEDYHAFCDEWFDAVSQFTDRIAFTPGIRNVFNYPRARWIAAWYKPGAVAYNSFGGLNVWEPILLYGKKTPKLVLDAFESTPLNFTKEEWKEHPCPKHPSLWRWLLNSISRPDETVLDIFAGSGTTARVAKDLGRNAVVVDCVERYCEIAAQRLAQEVLL